jgi:GNAT superfamily N-acetyltransferase
MKPPDSTKTHPLTIRAMSENDLASFCFLFQRSFAEAPWHETWTFEAINDLAWNIMRKEGYIGTVAEYNAASVGFAIGYRLFPAPLMPRLFYLDHIFVDKGFRGMGIGGGLLSKIGHLAAIRRMETMLLMTRKDSKAEALYLEEGFKRLLPFIRIQGKIVLYKKAG